MFYYSDLKAVFTERFIRKCLLIIIEPMFINGVGNWVNILNDAVKTKNKIIHSSFEMTPLDASNNPHKVNNTISLKTFKEFKVLKTQPKTYKIEDINDEIIEGKYYEQELFKSEFDFE